MKKLSEMEIRRVEMKRKFTILKLLPCCRYKVCEYSRHRVHIDTYTMFNRLYFNMKYIFVLLGTKKNICCSCNMTYPQYVLRPHELAYLIIISFQRSLTTKIIIYSMEIHFKPCTICSKIMSFLSLIAVTYDELQKVEKLFSALLKS